MLRASKKTSRGLALLLLGSMLLLVCIAIVMPYVALYRSGIERITALHDRLAHYRALADMRDSITEQLAAQAGDQETAANFVSNDTPALALADLQQHIKLAVGESGAQLLSTQALPIDEESDLLTATVRVGLRGDIESVQKLLYWLEARQPIVHIDNVAIRALASSQSAIARGGEQLDMRFDLTGYLRLKAR
ncbi:MAG TPA: type II secretion system protein GspM [Gammaproteobacteria bacterium]|nr:type II secretion system protein GspM [Gammaproteobacteria bacterium]